MEESLQRGAGRVRRGQLAVFLVLLAAFTVRVWFASSGLQPRYVFDERYTLENVDSFLQGAWHPVSGWYPSLSYLPHAALLFSVDRIAGLTGSDSWQLKRGEAFSPEAVLASRILQAVFGTIGIWLVFLIGRRLFDPAIGLAAAFFLAFVPGHIRLSAIVKPDVLMITLLLGVFLVSLRLAKRSEMRTVVLAGTLLGLAVAAKQYGIVSAIPLAAVLLLDRAPWRRRLLLLGVAAGTATVAFLVVNPWVRILVEYVGRNQRIYESFSQSPMQVLAIALYSPLSSPGHGTVLGVGAVIGVAALVVGVLRGRTTGSRGTGRSLLLITMAGYIAFCVAFLPWSKYNLWVPLYPFTSLALAFAVIWAFRRLRAAAGTLPSVLCVVACVGAGLWLGWSEIYKARVPTSEKVARALLNEIGRTGAPGLVYQESGLPPILDGARSGIWFGVSSVERLSDLSRSALDLADGEVFQASRLEQRGGRFYSRRIARYSGGAKEIRKSWFRVRGEDLVLIEHPWQRWGGPVDLRLEPAGREGDFAGQIPDPGRRRAVVSLEVRLDEGAASRGALEVGGAEIELIRTRRRGAGVHFVTPRFLIPARQEQPIVLRSAGSSAIESGEMTVRLHRWRSQVRGNAATQK